MAQYCKFSKKEIEVARYGNNDRIALLATDQETGERIATLTLNVPEIELQKNEVIIKDYSENEGVLQDLIDMNVVKNPHRFAKLPYVQTAICELSEEFLKENGLWQQQ